MALSTELYGLKSAGVYRFEQDQSIIQNTVVPLDNIRMLVGFSKIGPFNTPILINTTKEFTDTFGDIDRSLEKKGAYFHRSCLAALSSGPIYALNLLKLNPEDKVDVMKFATSSTCKAQTVNPNDNSYSYKGMYNIDTFYTPSEESFLSTVERSNTYISETSSTNDILDFTNIGKKPVSVIVTKSSEYNSSAYNVTAQEWYGKGKVPGYMYDTTLISDFMVDVYVLSGDWGGDFSTNEPYTRFSSDVKFSKYFDKNSGLKRKKLETDSTDTLLTQFLNESDVNLIGKYTGCLIPGFVDKVGHNIYIEYLINSDTNTNGLMCAVNEEIFDEMVTLDGATNGIDLIGHSVYDALQGDFTNANFLSYCGNISGDAIGTISTTEINTFTSSGDPSIYTIGGTHTLNTAIRTPETTETSINPVVKWVDSADSKTHTLYVYYYSETAQHVYEPISENTYATAINNIYNHVTDGGNVFFNFTDAATKLVPVTDVKKTLLYTKTDTSVAADIQGLLTTAYNGVNVNNISANPIIKYEFTLKSESAIDTTPTTEPTSETYFYDTDLETNFAINSATATKKIMFMECSEVYKSRSTLGTNDKLKLSTTNSDPTSIDINWTDNDYNVTTFGTYVIDNADYYPDYVIANIPNNTINISTTIYSFDHTNTSHLLSGGNLYIILGATNFNTTVEILKSIYTTTAKENEFIIPASDDESYANVKVGNYALSSNGTDTNGNAKHRLTKIISITGITNTQGVVDYRLVSCQDNISYNSLGTTESPIYSLEIFTKFTDVFKYYNVFTLGGFSLTSSHIPDGTDSRQQEILNLITVDNGDTNLYNSLIDRELIHFRYLVDTFGLGIEEMCKSQYTRLCQGRKSAFAIINMPSVNDFKNSTDPSFVDSNNSVSAEYIAKGGNPNTSPSFLFSLPDKVNGSTWGAYYYPYLKVYSNYTTITVPPAAYISNNFVDKYGAGSPWTLVAGQTRGVISGNNVVGVESSIIRANRDWLQPAGINSIIYQNGTGCVIYANKTAQQTPESALSSINCREACIYIQDNIEKILRNYLFETNTAQTRLEIKTLVDNFLDTVKNNGGVYNFKTVMDSSNNTNEVIDHNMGIIDVWVEPVRGLEILVQKLTILRTGAIESGTFE